MRGTGRRYRPSERDDFHFHSDNYDFWHFAAIIFTESHCTYGQISCQYLHQSFAALFRHFDSDYLIPDCNTVLEQITLNTWFMFYGKAYHHLMTLFTTLKKVENRCIAGTENRTLVL